MKKQISGLILGGLIAASCQSIHAESPQAAFETVEPSELQWFPVPNGLGAEFAVVHGNPTQAGTYVIRVHFPAGIMDLPHSHSADRHVTVIEGTWHVGIGPDFDPSQAQPLVAGSYMLHPAGGIHWDGSAGADGAIVQIIGTGPVTTEQNHDQASDWVKVN